jgi:NTE family protein
MKRSSKKRLKNDIPIINLALQGGGAHGAFTWGVLDRLLEHDIAVEGMSACSAGAINAALLVSGFEENGKEGARKKLKEFWEGLSSRSLFSPYQRSFFDRFLTPWSLDFSLFFLPFDIATRILSPYVNFFMHQYLKNFIDETIDFKLVAQSKIKLFITSTHIQTGQGSCFENKDLSPEVLLSSMSIPTFFPPTLVNNEPYWDGSYAGNPPLRPLVVKCIAKNIILVKSTPTLRKKAPIKTADILYRVNEIAFNSALSKELEFMEIMKESNPKQGEAAQWAKVNIFPIMSSLLANIPYSTKLNLEKEFIYKLFIEGRAQAENFLNKSELFLEP